MVDWRLRWGDVRNEKSDPSFEVLTKARHERGFFSEAVSKLKAFLEIPKLPFLSWEESESV